MRPSSKMFILAYQRSENLSLSWPFSHTCIETGTNNKVKQISCEAYIFQQVVFLKASFPPWIQRNDCELQSKCIPAPPLWTKNNNKKTPQRLKWKQAPLASDLPSLTVPLAQTDQWNWKTAATHPGTQCRYTVHLHCTQVLPVLNHKHWSPHPPLKKRLKYKGVGVGWGWG